MGYTEDIRLVLESSGCISYRFLAVQLNVTSDAAKRMLFEFNSKFGTQYFATVAISGIAKDEFSSYSTRVVPLRESVECKAAHFATVHSEHLYSIHLKESSAWSEEVAAADLSQFTGLLSNKPAYLRLVNGIGNICCTENNELLPDGARATAPLPTPPPTAFSSRSADNRPPLASANSFFSRNNSNSTSSSGSGSLSSKSAKVPSAVASFFGKPAAASSSTSKPATSSSTSGSKSIFGTSSSSSTPSKTAAGDTAPAADTSSASATAAADDDDEEEAEWGAGPKPSKAKLAARTTAAASRSILDDDEVWETAEKSGNARLSAELAAVDAAEKDKDKKGTSNKSIALSDDEDEGSDKGAMDVDGGGRKTSGGRKKKAPLVTRGAMDDYVNDHTFEGDYDAPKTTGATGSGAGTGGRKKHLVEKTFEDAKGYLVTEMVWEEMTAEEEAEEAAKEAVKAAAAAAAAAKKAAFLSGGGSKSVSSSGKSGSAGSGAQKSMMSFFGGGKK